MSLVMASPWRTVTKDQGRHLEQNQEEDRVFNKKSKAMELVLQKVHSITTNK